MSDSKETISRREFLNSAVAGASLLISGSVFTSAAQDEAAPSVPARQKIKNETAPSAPGQRKIYVCAPCGHVEFGSAPEFCPVCNTEEKFSLSNSIFSDAIAKWKDEEVNHTPVIAMQKKSTLVSDVPCREIGIRVGKKMHPVEEKDHIHFMDFYLDDKFFTRFPTSPHMYSAVSLFLKDSKSRLRAIAYCNMHGHWQAEAQL
jgi:desulfoferrodoxin-like iron-binding protein